MHLGVCVCSRACIKKHIFEYTSYFDAFPSYIHPEDLNLNNDVSIFVKNILTASNELELDFELSKQEDYSETF